MSICQTVSGKFGFYLFNYRLKFCHFPSFLPPDANALRFGVFFPLQKYPNKKHPALLRYWQKSRVPNLREAALL